MLKTFNSGFYILTNIYGAVLLTLCICYSNIIITFYACYSSVIPNLCIHAIHYITNIMYIIYI